MSEAPKKEKKRAIDYVGIAALVTAIPAALATMYGIQNNNQKNSETKQYGIVLAQGVFNAHAKKIDALSDKHTALLLELKDLQSELKVMKAMGSCGNKKVKYRPKAAKASPKASRKPAVMLDDDDEGIADIMPAMAVPKPTPPPMEEVSFEQVQEQAEIGEPWVQEQHQGQEE